MQSRKQNISTLYNVRNFETRDYTHTVSSKPGLISITNLVHTLLLVQWVYFIMKLFLGKGALGDKAYCVPI